MSNPFLWGTLGFLVGILIILGGPVILGPMLSIHNRQRIVNAYGGLMMLALDRALLVPREIQGIDLVASSLDGRLGRETAEVGGEQRDWRDPGARFGRLFSRPLGIAPEWANVICDTYDLVLAESERATADEYQTELPWTVGDEETTAYRGEVELNSWWRPRSVSALKAALTGGGNSSQADRTEQIIKNSQQGYKTRQVVEVMTVIIAGGAGAILAWFLKNQGGNITGALPTNPDPTLIWLAGVLI